MVRRQNLHTMKITAEGKSYFPARCKILSLESFSEFLNYLKKDPYTWHSTQFSLRAEIKYEKTFKLNFYLVIAMTEYEFIKVFLFTREPYVGCFLATN